MCKPRYNVLEDDHSRDCGHVIPNTVSGRGHPGNQRCDLMYRVWEVVILETVDV